jgi:hypothetical protein
MKCKDMSKKITCETTMIKEHQKFIEEKGSFEKYSYEFD